MNVIAARFINALALVLDYVFFYYTWIVIIRVLTTWVNADPWNPIVQTLSKLTDPLLDPIRRQMSRIVGHRHLGVDFSPVVLIIMVYLFGNVLLVNILQYIALQFL